MFQSARPDKKRPRWKHEAGRNLFHPSRILPGFLLCGLLLTGIGCAPRIQERVTTVFLFPPREVMETHEYERFRSRNEEALRLCEASHDCAESLFNLAFVHVYPLSPVFDQSRGLKYLDELIEKYPDSPLAYQGRVWVTLIRQSLAAEERRRQLGRKIKSKDTTIKKLREEVERSREVDQEIDEKDTTIKKLREQIERSREIDLEIDQKERELLQ